MRLLDAVTRATRELRDAGIDPREAALDAELLARHALGWDRAAWLVRQREAAPAGFDAAFGPLIDRRKTREPLAYIRGVHEFWSRDFLVTPAVLIPRPETELLIEEALAWLPASADARVLDIGTGSGCLAITLALERPRAQVIATDISHTALGIAQRNAMGLGANRIRFEHGSVLAGTEGPFDLIVSNPPYVAERDRQLLAPEVAREPALALFAGPDGLDTVRDLLRESPRALAPTGRLLFEIGFGQAEAVAAAVAAVAGLRLARITPDLQGIPRIAVADRTPGER